MSTDSATKGMYVRFVNVEKDMIVEDFLQIKEVVGHPTADAILSAMMEVFEPEDDDCKLPLGRLASTTSDGAPVMISQKNGVNFNRL